MAKKLADAEASIGATKAKALTNVKDIAGDTVVSVVNALSNLNVSKDEVDRALTTVSPEK